jgi:hypothetical protein
MENGKSIATSCGSRQGPSANLTSSRMSQLSRLTMHNVLNHAPTPEIMISVSMFQGSSMIKLGTWDVQYMSLGKCVNGKSAPWDISHKAHAP